MALHLRTDWEIYREKTMPGHYSVITDTGYVIGRIYPHLAQPGTWEWGFNAAPTNEPQFNGYEVSLDAAKTALAKAFRAYLAREGIEEDAFVPAYSKTPLSEERRRALRLPVKGD
jgi:hypothetical protein